MGVVLTTLVAPRAERGLGPSAFRRLAVALASPTALAPSIVRAIFTPSQGLDDELFDRVARAVDQRRLTLPPFAVIGGPGASTLPAFRVRDGLPEAPPPLVLHHAGVAPAALGAAVEAALAKGEVCVWYAKPPFGRGFLLDHDPGGECRITLRRATSPRSLTVGSAYDDDPAATVRGPCTTTWLEVSGKSAPDA